MNRLQNMAASAAACRPKLPAGAWAATCWAQEQLDRLEAGYTSQGPCRHTTCAAAAGQPSLVKAAAATLAAACTKHEENKCSAVDSGSCSMLVASLRQTPDAGAVRAVCALVRSVTTADDPRPPASRYELGLSWNAVVCLLSEGLGAVCNGNEQGLDQAPVHNFLNVPAACSLEACHCCSMGGTSGYCCAVCTSCCCLWVWRLAMTTRVCVGCLLYSADTASQVMLSFTVGASRMQGCCPRLGAT